MQLVGQMVQFTCFLDISHFLCSALFYTDNALNTCTLQGFVYNKRVNEDKFV